MMFLRGNALIKIAKLFITDEDNGYDDEEWDDDETGTWSN